MISIGTSIHSAWSRLAGLLGRLAPLADLAVRPAAQRCLFFRAGPAGEFHLRQRRGLASARDEQPY